MAAKRKWRQRRGETQRGGMASKYRSVMAIGGKAKMAWRQMRSNGENGRSGGYGGEAAYRNMKRK